MGFVHKKCVACEEDFLLKLYQSYRDLQLVPGHYNLIYPSGLAFQLHQVIAPKFPLDSYGSGF